MRFVHFGCWGNYKHLNHIKSTLQNINELSIKPNMLIVAGDNYYSEKTKEKFEGKKLREFNDREFSELFYNLNELTQNINSRYLLLGNHEFDMFKQDSNNNNNFINKSSLMKQFKFCMKNNFIPYTNILHKIENNTLFIMIDSNLFSDELDPIDLELYKSLNIYNSNLLENINLEYLKNKHEFEIEKILDENINSVNHIIISGHHPIKGCKVKSQGVYKENYCKNLHHMFIRLGKKFINCMGGKNKLYYLCADVHCYQKINLNISLGGKNNLIIEQHIVGTGGAEFDNCPQLHLENIEEENVSNTNSSKILNSSKLLNVSNKSCKKYKDLIVKVEKSLSNTYGYLLCDLKLNKWEFNFVDIYNNKNKTKKEGGYSIKKYTKKNKYKSKLTKKK